MKITKAKVTKALIKEFGYAKETAVNLIEKHIDVFETNQEESTPIELANKLEEAEMQSHDDEDFE